MSSFHVCLWASLSFLMLGVQAQGQSALEVASERYLARVAAADKTKTEALSRLQQGYDNELKAAKDETAAAFDALIQSAALRSRTEEVRQLTLQREALISGQGQAAAFASGGKEGFQYQDLVGTWVSKPRPGYTSTYTFEFSASKEMIYTYEYKSNTGENKNTYRYQATAKEDRIIFDSPNFTDPTSNYYEIVLPFDPNDLAITHHFKTTTGIGSNTYKLERKK